MPPSGLHPGALSVHVSAVVRVLLALASLPVVGSTSSAEATKPTDPPFARKDAFRDIQLAKKVRDALREDKQLSLLKLFIVVKDRVAILEGEVASADQLREATKRVEKVPGITEVRISLVKVVVPKNDDVLIIPLQPDPPSRAETFSPYRISGVIGRSTALPHFPETIPEIVSVRLEPPIPLPPPTAVEPVTTLRTATPLTEDVVTAAVERARQSNPRFRALEVEVRGETVWLRGTAEQIDTGMEFARALAVLGVRHVVIQCNVRDGR